jgi:hypothetical protein
VWTFLLHAFAGFAGELYIIKKENQPNKKSDYYDIIVF